MSKYQLSICTIAKNEGPYLLEWFEFHKLVGVEHFYFYDNESTDDTKKILDFYVNLGQATYHYWPGKKTARWVEKGRTAYPAAPHQGAITHCLHNYKNHTKWLAIIDLDEFLFSPETNNLQNILEEYQNFPAIAVNWLTFGSSGHLNKPKGLQIENFIKRSSTNDHQNRVVKIICQPSKVIKSSSHNATPVSGNVVTENKDSYKGETKGKNRKRTVRHSSQKLRINHYYTRSREEHLNKARWKPWKGELEQFQKLNKKLNEVEDLTIQRFVPTLKRNIMKMNLKISDFKLQTLKKELISLKH